MLLFEEIYAQKIDGLFSSNLVSVDNVAGPGHAENPGIERARID